MNASTLPQNISVIGSGNMGSALAEAFIAAGLTTTVWNRTTSKVKPLVGKGAESAETAAEAVKVSPLVIICVADYDAVYNILEPILDTFSGKTLLNLTNGTPEEARKIAKWTAVQNIVYLDGGIMAIPPMIGQAGSFILYSGSKQAFEGNRAVLDHLGNSMYLGVDPGLASLYDLAMLSGMYGIFTGFLQAVALISSEKTETTATAFTSSMLIPWLEAMTTTLPQLAKQIDNGSYQTEGSNLKMQAVALANILEASQSQNINADLLAPLHELAMKRISDGHATDDISGLIELIKNH